MFNTRSELTVTNSDVHRLLKYAITDDDEQTNDRFDKMEHLQGMQKPSRIQKKMTGTSSTCDT